MYKHLVLIAVAGVAVGCSQSPELRAPVGGAADVAGAEAPREANLRTVAHDTAAAGAVDHAGNVHGDSQQVHYTCPMHPQIDVMTPGKCPICGMALVVKASAKGAP